VIVDVVEIEQKVRRIAQSNVEKCAGAASVQLAVLLTRVDVGLIANALQGRSAGDAGLDGIGQRPADRRRDVGRVPAAVIDIHIALKIIRRTLRNDVDRAARRILAVKRSLRTLEDLDAIDVV
jgi:hypothetical protein